MRSIDIAGKKPSHISVDNEQGIASVDDALQMLVEKAAFTALELDYMNFGCELDIIFTDDDGIRRVNKEFRQIDSSTDVLSFPLVEMAEGRILTDEGDYDMDSGLLVLGDIIISLQTAGRQAAEYGHSYERECAFLVTHGVFHLLGYDHDDKEREAKMLAKQEDVLGRLGLARQ